MGNATSSSGRGHSDNGSESDNDMDQLRDAVQSAVVAGGNRIAVSTGDSIAVSAGNSSSAACKLAMSHNIHYDVTQFVTY
jgi:hypothetical protein